MVETTFIYFLKDPENPNKGYVGKSDNPKGRFSHHLHVKDRKPNYRTNWIAALLTRGLRPVLEILDEVPKSEWQFWEQEYIRVFRALGIKLVNNTFGGDGQSGQKQTPESSAKKRKKRLGATSKFLGVCWNAKRKKWRASVTVDSRDRHVGYLLDEIEAAKAYDEAAIKFCGEHAVLNFP